MKLPIEIRKFKESDLDECISLFRDTVHTVNTKHYTQSQVDVWAPANIDKAVWNKQLAENITYVAIYNNQVVGFGCMTPQGYFDLLYVHKDFQRQGIAKSIVLKFETLAKQLGIKEITTETSITAKPFRESMGYQVVKQQLKEFRGEKFINYVMKKVIK